MELVYAIGAVASALAAVLAWLAKLAWAREYSTAKDEIIRAKDAQIAAVERELASLRDLTPMRIREYFESVKVQLEEYNEYLRAQLKDAHRLIAEREAEIDRLAAAEGAQASEIARLKAEKEKLQRATAELEAGLQAAKEAGPPAEGEVLVPAGLGFWRSLDTQSRRLDGLLERNRYLDALAKPTNLDRLFSLDRALSELAGESPKWFEPVSSVTAHEIEP